MSDKLVRVRADGTGITESGKERKTKFFEILSWDIDDYSDLGSFTPEEARRIHNHISKLQTGATAMVPLYCGGDLCPFKTKCPFWQMGKAPVQRQCLLEVSMLKHWIYQYMEEYDVDPENFTELGYCNELAEIEIYLWRINNNLAKPENAELVVEQAVGVDKSGVAIMQQQVSPFMEMKEKLQNRRSRIIKLMVGDRQEKYKKESALKMRGDKDPSTRQSEIKRKIEELRRKVEGLGSREDIKRLSPAPEKKILTPEDLINSPDDEE